MDKFVVDGSDLQAWPSIVDSRRQNESLSNASCECNRGMQKNKTEQVVLGVAADVGNSESISPSSCEALFNSADSESVQQEIQSQDGEQWEDDRVGKDAGPKHAEADFDDDCKTLNEAVQLPTFSLTLEALTPDTCHSRSGGELLETGEKWGTSGESQGGWKDTVNEGVRHEVSQTVCSGLTKQAAIIIQSDMPKESMSGHVKESSPGCLQGTQIITTSTRTDSEKGMSKKEWEGSECASADHGGSEDGTWSQNNSRVQPSGTEVTLQSMLIRNDLDPRVLCNTGWGQTQIKQSIAWDLEVDSSAESGRDWTGHDQINLNSPGCPQWCRDLPDKVKGARSQGAGNKEEQSQEKVDKEVALLSGRVNSWVKAVENEQVGRWDGNRRDCVQQREKDQGNWDSGDTQWGENKGRDGQGEKDKVADSEDEGWRSKQHHGWGNYHQSQNLPNSQTASKGPNLHHQQSRSQLTQPRGSWEVRHPPAGPMAVNQNSGWTPGPVPHTSSAIESSGWEEPSPQSISRKMEIDDGTSAWGDPAHYDKRSVNMWDKSNLQQRDQASHQRHESMPATTLTSRDKNTGWK